MGSYLTPPKVLAELERLKIDVASEFRDPTDYQFLVGMHHIDD